MPIMRTMEKGSLVCTCIDTTYLICQQQALIRYSTHTCSLMLLLLMPLLLQLLLSLLLLLLCCWWRCRMPRGWCLAWVSSCSSRHVAVLG
jgi:hypothetical protein